MLTTKKKFAFPLFFSLKFCGEWLTANPASFEKRIFGLCDPLPSKFWKSHQLPPLTTPINSIEILKTKRMMILIQMSESTQQTVENFAFCTVIFEQLQQVGDQKFSGLLTGPVIGYNALLGNFEFEVEYDVVQETNQIEAITQQIDDFEVELADQIAEDQQ